MQEGLEIPENLKVKTFFGNFFEGVSTCTER
jgi:hypothetical protein